MPDVSGRIHGEGAKLVTVVPISELQNAFGDTRDDAELVVVSVSSMSIAATGNVKQIQGRLKAILATKKDPVLRVRIELEQSGDGIFHIKTVKAV